MDEIKGLQEEKQRVLMKQADNEEHKLRIKEMHEFIESDGLELTTYDGHLVRKLIEKIVIHDDYYEVIFKSGISENIER